MVSNTIGIQTGVDPATARIEFFHGQEGTKPAALIRPADGVGVFWLSHGGIHTEKGLYLFMSQIVSRPGDESVFGFRAIGIVMAKIANPQDRPDQWRIQQIKVPWAQFDPGGGERAFGMPLLREGGIVYLYGLEIDKKTSDRHLLVGRANAASIEDFSSWEFYADGGWQHDFRKASRLCNHMGAELSVS